MPQLLETVPPLTPAQRGAVLVVSSLLMLSALVVGGRLLLDAIGGVNQNWPGLGFEAITILGCMFGVLTGLGRFREGPAMALACVLGTVLISAGLGRLSAVQTPAAVLADPWFLARTALVGVLALVATVAVVSRHPKGWKTLLIGSVLGILGGSGLIGGYLAWGTLGGSGGALGTVLRTLVGLTGAVAVAGLLCAAVHFTVRAFELGRARDDAPPAERA